jgi:hypothetical protein
VSYAHDFRSAHALRSVSCIQQQSSRQKYTSKTMLFQSILATLAAISLNFVGSVPLPTNDVLPVAVVETTTMNQDYVPLPHLTNDVFPGAAAETMSVDQEVSVASATIAANPDDEDTCCPWYCSSSMNPKAASTIEDCAICLKVPIHPVNNIDHSMRSYFLRALYLRMVFEDNDKGSKPSYVRW